MPMHANISFQVIEEASVKTVKPELKMIVEMIIDRVMNHVITPPHAKEAGPPT
jgi:hypothetical protein